MTETVGQQQGPQVNNSSEGLYFQIVCDPGHERTARELSELPRESRERVWADMIGAQQQDQQQHSSERRASSSSHMSDLEEGMTHHHHGTEDPAFIREQLAAFEEELKNTNNIPPSEGLALALKTPLGNDPEFRLSFLRARSFDVADAAQRFGIHFDLKVALFGKSKVGQAIRLTDLSEDDLESLQCGAMQFLPKTDRGGRLVMLSRYRNFVFKTQDNMLRALWYMLMSALETPAVSKVGLVIVGYEVGDSVPVDYELVRKMVRMVRTLPIRVVASHSCYSDSPMQKVADLIVHMVSSFVRLRLRMHYGSHQECRYRLLTMGIPVDYLPITMDGVLHNDNHRQWLQFRIHQEQRGGGGGGGAHQGLQDHNDLPPPAAHELNYIAVQQQQQQRRHVVVEEENDDEDVDMES